MSINDLGKVFYPVSTDAPVGNFLKPTDIIDNLNTTDANRVLSANQGNVLSGMISQIQQIVDKATTDVESAKTTAIEAKTAADNVDAKATQAQNDAMNAKFEAETAKDIANQALIKTPTLATQTTPGIVKGSDTVTIDTEGRLHTIGGNNGIAVFVGQWVFLRQNLLPIGYVQLDGLIFPATKFPNLVSYLEEHTDECITEVDWQARSASASGIGGVPYYVYDTIENTIRFPDTRGDSLYHGVQGWQGDAIRNISGETGTVNAGGGWIASFHKTSTSGAFSAENKSASPTHGLNSISGGSMNTANLIFNASKAVPTDITNHPRRVGMTWAVYVGTVGE